MVLRSDHDRALGTLYPAVTWGNQVERAPRPRAGSPCARGRGAERAGRGGRARASARPSWTWSTSQRTGLPARAWSTSTARAWSTRDEWLIGAHRDIYHDEIATLVCLAAGLLTGGPAGPARGRSRPSRRP